MIKQLLIQFYNEFLKVYSDEQYAEFDWVTFKPMKMPIILESEVDICNCKWRDSIWVYNCNMLTHNYEPLYILFEDIETIHTEDSFEMQDEQLRIRNEKV